MTKSPVSCRSQHGWDDKPREVHQEHPAARALMSRVFFQLQAAPPGYGATGDHPRNHNQESGIVYWVSSTTLPKSHVFVYIQATNLLRIKSGDLQIFRLRTEALRQSNSTADRHTPMARNTWRLSQQPRALSFFRAAFRRRFTFLRGGSSGTMMGFPWGSPNSTLDGFCSGKSDQNG